MPTGKSLLILLIAAAASFLPADVSASTAPGNGEHSEKRELRLLFTGDILLSRGVDRQFARNPQPLGRALQPMLSGAEWVVGNLEGAVGPPDACPASDLAVPCFSIRKELIPALRQAGFNALGLANNHSSDLGDKGLEATRRLLAEYGIMSLSFEASPQFARFDDIIVGFVSLSLVPERAGRPVDVPGTALRQRLRSARSLSNLVVVYVHWGSEFLDWPDKRQRKAAKWLVENGADIIIGHHPHLVQSPECLLGKPVFYSLGNFIFDQKFPSTRVGLLADCRIRNEQASCSGLLTRTPSGSTLPALTGADADTGKNLAGCVFNLASPLILGNITIRPETARAGEYSSGVTLEALRDDKLIWKSRPAKIVSIEPMKVEAPKPMEYLFTLERHYSPLDVEEGLRPCVYEAGPRGLIPRWRGSALAWPLIDAAFLPKDRGILCALHRGDSFIKPQPGTDRRRIAAYRWKGFGFSGIHDPEVIASCRDLFQ
ncbi:MAG: CapA family protein [Syntrophobacteraceae bacterium]